MGKTIEVNSLEKMCDLMCDNKIPEEKETWIFTFGKGQKHEGHYVKFDGTYKSARQKMVDKYGLEWGFQYSEKEWTEMENNPDRWWPMETELKGEWYGE